jgi:hypothetical protein
MPFDPPFDDTWWPNPGPPRNGPADPGYWNDPFINTPATSTNPFANVPPPWSAARLGAMAWHPPIFLGDPSTFVPSNFPAAAWPPHPGALFSRDPSIPYSGGLFPYPLGPATDAEPSALSGGLLGEFGRRASTLGVPDAWPAPGWPAAQSPFAPLAQSQKPFAADGSAPAVSYGLLPSPPDSSATPAPPQRSVLFNAAQPAWDLGAHLLERERDAATLDSTAQGLGPAELPLSKSGAPYVSPNPQPSIISQLPPWQWLDAARFLSPNLVDYFTKTLPPAPPFPSTPGKIPSADNPYAGGAAIEAATWLLAGIERGIAGPLVRSASVAEKFATEAALRAVKSAADAPALTRAAEQLATGPYGQLSGTLPLGVQAHHLNQNAVYREFISPTEGFSVGMRGNIIAEPGTPHYIYHRSMEDFWDQYRKGGGLEHSMPTNAEYGEASRRALVASGLPPAQALDLEARAAMQRAEKGLSESEPVPNIPTEIWRRRRK